MVASVDCVKEVADVDVNVCEGLVWRVFSGQWRRRRNPREILCTHFLALRLAVERTLDTKVTAESCPGFKTGEVDAVLGTESVCDRRYSNLLLDFLLSPCQRHDLGFHRLRVNDDWVFLLG